MRSGSTTWVLGMVADKGHALSEAPATVGVNATVSVSNPYRVYVDHLALIHTSVRE